MNIIIYTYFEEMITFLVHGNFIINAQLLDNQRLGKQRVEACQILNAIENGAGWKNHPITKAWKYYINALKYYTNCIILEWIRRGGQNNIPLFEIPNFILIPWWSQWDRLHQSHRAMLMRKNPFFYQDKFTVEPEYTDYGYIWPHNISYQDRFLSLDQITAPIPDELIDAVYCKATKNNGEQCQRLVKDKYPYCTIHRKNNSL